MAGPTHVLDASALLAVLLGEEGGERALGLLSTSVICAVNWSEVCLRLPGARLQAAGAAPAVRERLLAVGTLIEPFGTEDAEMAAQLRSVTRSAGLSLGDRACLALARRLGRPAVTADRAWAGLALNVEVEVIR